jgi:uncharacterized membrane protein YfcA
MGDQALILVATFAALVVSSTAGYGGSLILVPALAAAIGPKSGIAYSALVLGWNNVFKVLAYRKTLAIKQGWPLLAVTAVGTLFGARLLVAAPETFVVWCVIVGTIAALAIELSGSERLLSARRSSAVPAMAASAVLSGVSGSSGPLKGVAVRSLGLPRLEHVGLASLVSLVADALKVGLFQADGLFDDIDMTTLLIALPLMPLGAWFGRAINRRVDERVFRGIFWAVVGCYTLRMANLWF